MHDFVPNSYSRSLSHSLSLGLPRVENNMRSISIYLWNFDFSLSSKVAPLSEYHLEMSTEFLL